MLVVLVLLGGVGACAAVYSFDPEGQPLFFAIGASLCVGASALVCARRPARPKRAVVLGPPELASELRSELDSRASGRWIRIHGVLRQDRRVARNLAEIIRGEQVDQIVIADELRAADVIEELRDAFAPKVSIIWLADFYEMRLGRAPLAMADSRFLAFALQPRSPASDIVRRALDIIVSVVALIAFAPVFAIVMVVVRRDGGPALYRQRRIGRGGRDFEILKFRSMRSSSRVDEEWSTANDPRVTRIGRFLRRSHLDELPQLINVMRGEMSIVGPRPEQPAIACSLESTIPLYAWRQRLRPGLTGWAQVQAGYGGSVQGSMLKVSYDFYYLRHRSLLLDLLVIAETIRCVLPWSSQWDEPVVSSAFLARDAGPIIDLRESAQQTSSQPVESVTR